ncbi:hypothetical protein [Aquimarina sp. 2201CG14-23]|uniref:hypothetical protein n=1 Tax=Aquimarina mycalae TaxID=3040073 RepID=UPI0024781631|nr:hypothetical protein [Aquimarina sp. 2201CG14-23]MDH7447399.1 hypothetical protein [Aquimarina sp. 2201CG14-23]
MKKSLKKLELNKQTISNFNLRKVRGGSDTVIGCYGGNVSVNVCGNSVPVAQGGIGCHAK